MSDRLPDRMSEYMSDRIIYIYYIYIYQLSEKRRDRLSESMADRMQECMSGKMPE